MFLIIVTSLVAYFVIGVVAARIAAVPVAKHFHSEFSHHPSRAEDETRNLLLIIAVAWPLGLVAVAVYGLRAFVYAPVTKRQDHVEKLRADAKYWDGVARDEVDDEKKAMAKELAKSLREQAKEIGL